MHFATPLNISAKRAMTLEVDLTNNYNRKINTMKKLLILIVMFVSISALGQNRYSRRSQGLSFKGVGMGAGLFFPSLDYYKNRTGYDFKPGIATQLNGELSLKYPVSMRLGVGYARTSGTQLVTVGWSEETNLTFVPLTADLLFNYSIGGSRQPHKFRNSHFALDLYAGGGVGYNLLYINYQSTDGDSQKNSGSTYTYNGILGIQYPMHALKIGIEGQYAFGNYSQTFGSNNGNESFETVNINGPKIMLTVFYDISSANSHSKGRRGYSKGRNRSYKSRKKRNYKRR